MQRLIFVRTKNNLNSLAALTGAIEKENLQLAVNFVEKDNLLKFLKNLKTNSLDTVIAFSFQTPEVFRLKELIFKVKQINSDWLLIAGGAHPSGAPEHTLKMGFDYVFMGEAEESLVEFLKKLLVGKKPQDKIIKSKPVDITQYLSISGKYKAFATIEITRGCPFGCRYCQTTFLFGPMRHRKIQQIVKMAEILVQHNLCDIRFISPNLLSYGSQDGFKPNLNQLEKMLASVRSVKGVKKIFAGTFPSEIRPEQLTKEALKIIRKYCDNDNLIIGAQSGSDQMLKKCHRFHTVVDIQYAINLALEAGFKVNVDFIFGMPEETKNEEKETIRFIEKLVKIKNVRIHGHTFLPLPGTPWEKEKAGEISPHLREFLMFLRKNGKEYGDWEEQEQMGKLLPII